MSQLVFNNPKVKKFFVKHGEYIQIPDSNFLLFEDGARCEYSNGSCGVMMPPPSDDWERAKSICEYWEIIATDAEDDFEEFKSYLHGTGSCPPGIYTDEEKLEHLTMLRDKARETAKRYRRARKAVQKVTPDWQTASMKLDAELQRDEQKFMEQVKSITL